MLKFLAIVTFACVVCGGAISAKPMAELKLSNNIRIDTEHVDCKSAQEFIDECGLQQGSSYRFQDFPYPTNHTHLLSSCKRQSDALKCLRAYAKCLPPLSKQVLLAMVSSRLKYNKKMCTEKPNELSTKWLEFGTCMQANSNLLEKGIQAEINAIAMPEAIIDHKIDNVGQRLKQSCCAVARSRKEFMDTTIPNCKQYSLVASDHIDSYLADTVGIICPDFERSRHDCDKLPKLPMAKSTSSKFFLRPILNVVQTLA